MIKNYVTHFIGLLLAMLFYSSSLPGQTPVKLHDTENLIDIGESVLYVEDASRQLTIDDIIKLSDDQFTTNPRETINFSSTASAYWLKFRIYKDKSDNFYLNLGYAYIDSISLYEFDGDNELLATSHTGDELPFSNREIEVGNYLFALDFEEGVTRTFYLRVKSDQPLFFPLKVGTLSNFVAYEHDLDFLQGIYFGFMLLIFFYNLFLYFSTREKIYLYYIAYVFSITWFMASVFGYFFEYFWPNHPVVNQLVVVSSGLTMITATLFTQKFLNTKESGSRLHKVSMVFLGLGFLVCLLVIFNFRIEGLRVAQGGLLLMALFFLILGIRFRMKGYRPAKYYLVAWGTLLLGICFAILESLDLIFLMPYLNAMQIGSALEVLLLSFALGDRINMYKKQKEDAQLQALIAAKENERLIQEQNVILEEKVKERTAKVASQNERLIALNHEKDMLVSMVAHDLRTPLHRMKGIVWLLDIPALGKELPKEKIGYLNEMDNSVDRLTDMIGRILNTHALEANELNLKIESVNLRDLVEYTSQRFHLTAADKDIKVHVKAESKHTIDTDKNYLIQVLENLISNAIKFTPKGGKVTLHVKAIEDKPSIIVEDNGPGISEEDQKKLFGRFQRLSAQPTGGELSIGLGLSIVKKFVDALGGEISCESKLGEGTQFIISFSADNINTP